MSFSPAKDKEEAAAAKEEVDLEAAREESDLNSEIKQETSPQPSTRGALSQASKGVVMDAEELSSLELDKLLKVRSKLLNSVEIANSLVESKLNSQTHVLSLITA